MRKALFLLMSNNNAKNQKNKLEELKIFESMYLEEELEEMENSGLYWQLTAKRILFGKHQKRSIYPLLVNIV